MPEMTLKSFEIIGEAVGGTVRRNFFSPHVFVAQILELNYAEDRDNKARLIPRLG
jgi:hypothetical protein